MKSRKANQKTLKHKNFQYDADLESWVNDNIQVSQILSITETRNGGDHSVTIWYWEIEYKDIKKPNDRIVEDHYADCDGLCYECEGFTWCEFSPYEKTEEIFYIDKEQ